MFLSSMSMSLSMSSMSQAQMFEISTAFTSYIEVMSTHRAMIRSGEEKKSSYTPRRVITKCPYDTTKNSRQERRKTNNICFA